MVSKRRGIGRQSHYPHVFVPLGVGCPVFLRLLEPKPKTRFLTYAWLARGALLAVSYTLQRHLKAS